MRILLVEDNHRLNASLRQSLVEDGYAVDSAFDGEEGEELAVLTSYDVIILDIMLPIKDGLEVCRSLRKKHNNTPVLMLTARDTVDDRILGLDSGADDYLIKPFALGELRARLRALLRRDGGDKSSLLIIGDLTLDPATHVAERGGQVVQLTAKEFSLLEYFMRNAGRMISRQVVEDHVWDYDFVSGSNVVDVYIRRLRRKIDDPFEVKLFETVRGAGYRLHKPVESR
ncbi:MAG TPA: response regulator transcription factor [Anaerolineaceae bacterium]|jgi:two-component system, OmpR family, copper resistance phosphate regulon response regulator CusR